MEVRPLRQMTGGASFNEVFFNEVRVHDDHRLGDVNNGWTVALTTLMNERAAIGAGAAGRRRRDPDAVVEMARTSGQADDPLVRQQLADTSLLQVAGYTNQRALDKLAVGQLPGPELSIAKLAGTRAAARLGDFVGRCSDRSSPPTPASGARTLGASSCSACPGMRIAGGTDEVMRNIVGERVLGLPKEPPPR